PITLEMPTGVQDPVFGGYNLSIDPNAAFDPRSPQNQQQARRALMGYASHARDFPNMLTGYPAYAQAVMEAAAGFGGGGPWTPEQRAILEPLIAQAMQEQA
ncbi:unnamed protein product, partial [marine sediment metagenome]